MLERLCAKHGGQTALCLAGGVAFNCVANGKIFDPTPFEHVYVQPAAGDAGLSVGAAFYVHHSIRGQPANSLWTTRIGARDILLPIFGRLWIALCSSGEADISELAEARACCNRPRGTSPTEKLWVGFREQPNGVPEPWVTAAFSPIPDVRK